MGPHRRPEIRRRDGLHQPRAGPDRLRPGRGPRRGGEKMRLRKDALARRAMSFVAALPGILVLLIVIGLFLKSKAILGVEPLSRLLFSSAWHPLKGQFGLLAFITGTVWVTVTALVLAVPVSILAAIYLSEYAPRWVRESAKPVVDLLAGLPSVVYGVWGVILVVPFVGGVLAPLAGVYSSGYSVLAGGIVLAIMTFPTIIHVTLEVFASVPRSLRDASLSLGAT
ncbi:MAG: ABC transporter permease subunit, partial [Candidatus Aminicenantes bacterium]